MSSESQRILDKYNKHKASSFDVRNQQRRQMAEKARKEAEERRKKRQRDREARLNIKPNSQAELHKSIRENEQVPTKKRKEDREKEKERQYHTYAEDDPALKVFYNAQSIEEARKLRQRKLDAAGGKQRPSWRHFSIPNNVVLTPPPRVGAKTDPFFKKAERAELELTDNEQGYLDMLAEKREDIDEHEDKLKDIDFKIHTQNKRGYVRGTYRARPHIVAIRQDKAVKLAQLAKEKEQAVKEQQFLQGELDSFQIQNMGIGKQIEQKKEKIETDFKTAQNARIAKSRSRKELFEHQLFQALPKTQGGLESIITGKNRPTLRSVEFDPVTQKTFALYSDAGIIPTDDGKYIVPAGSTFSASIASRKFDISRIGLDTNADKIKANKARKSGQSLDNFKDVVGSLEVRVVTKTNNHGQRALNYNVGGDRYSAKGILAKKPDLFIDNSFMGLDIINNSKKTKQDLDNFGAYRRHISTTARVTKDKQKSRGRSRSPSRSKKRPAPPPPVFGGLF